MAEKTASDVNDVSHDEKNGINDRELVEETGRRQSVALNIVENPLQVSLQIPFWPQV
jgi:hypothetical protein